jgi:hypothetical protein
LKYNFGNQNSSRHSGIEEFPDEPKTFRLLFQQFRTMVKKAKGSHARAATCWGIDMEECVHCKAQIGFSQNEILQNKLKDCGSQLTLAGALGFAFDSNKCSDKQTKGKT